MNRLKWTLKQILPMTYWTTYSDGDGRWFCMWRMWLGRCSDIVRIPVC